MAEKTGLDVLTELVDEIKLLNKKIDLLDQNVKILLNKDKGKVITTVQAIDPSKIQAPKEQGKMIIKKEYPKRVGAMAGGKIIATVDKIQVQIYEADVRIFDEKNIVVKETSTNKSGVWQCLLKPGKYVAEIKGKYRGKYLPVQNKSFVVPDGVDKLEVM